MLLLLMALPPILRPQRTKGVAVRPNHTLYIVHDLVILVTGGSIRNRHALLLILTFHIIVRFLPDIKINRLRHISVRVPLLGIKSRRPWLEIFLDIYRTFHFFQVILALHLQRLVQRLGHR